MKFNRPSRIIAIIMIVVLALLFVVPIAYGQGEQPPEPTWTVHPTVTLPSDDLGYVPVTPVEQPVAEPVDFAGLLAQFGALAGVSGLIAAFVNICKSIGWVKDGKAPTWSAGLSLLALATLFALGVFRPDVDIKGLDQQAANLANFSLVLFGYISQLGLAKLSHNALKGLPVVGKSHTPEPATITGAAVGIKVYAGAGEDQSEDGR
jgi:hypothetical protein